MEEQKRLHLLKEYRQGYQMIKEKLHELPEEMWLYKPTDKEWSVQEVVVHLADSEAVGYVRCRKLIAENGAEIAPYDQDMWAVDLNYQEQDPNDALELFRSLRWCTYCLLRKLPESVWNTNFVTHPVRGNITLDDWLEIYVEHVERHLVQMDRIFDHWKKDSKK